MALRRLLYIFIPILSILLMSHNVNAAVQLTQDVVLVRGNFQSQFMGSTWVNETCLTGGNYWLQNNCADQNIFASFLRISIPNIDYPVGYFITVDLYLYNNNASDSLDGWLTGMQVNSESQGWVDLVDVSYESISASSGVAHLTFRSFSGGTRSTIALSWPGGNFLKLYNQERIALGTTTVWNTRITSYTQAIGSAVDAINNLNNSINSMSSKLNELGNLSTNQQQTNQKLDQLYQQQQQQQQKEDAAIDNISEQSTDDIESADDSGAQNLITSLGGIVNQLRNIPDSDTCSIDGDLGMVDMGNISFCTGRDKLPFIVTFFAYVLELGLVVIAAIVVYRRIVFMIGYARNG